MTTNLTRRATLLGTVTLPAALAPLGTLRAATTPNATDAAWAELEAANAAWEEHKAAEEAFEASLPIRPKPDPADFFEGRIGREEHLAQDEAWQRERALLPANPHETTDAVLDAFIGRINAAENAILETPAATLTDLERKLTVIGDLAAENEVERWWLDSALADARRLAGRAA